MDTLQDKIIWPCQLPASTKEAIVLCAIRANQLGANTGSTRPIPGITYINSGIACISFGAEQTNSMNSGVYGKGSWLGGSMINQSFKLHTTIEELEPVDVIFFPKDKIELLAERDPHVYKLLYFCSLDSQQQWLTAQIVSLYNRETRVVFALLEVARHTTQIKGSVLSVNASQKQLSNITGISRPRLNEVLKMLETNGEISVSRGTIHLIDVDALQARLEAISNTIVTATQ